MDVHVNGDAHEMTMCSPADQKVMMNWRMKYSSGSSLRCCVECVCTNIELVTAAVD